MSYISGNVPTSNTVSTEIRGTIKNELVDTNTRLEAIETELGHITSHLASIAETLQDVGKKNGTKPHRHIESVEPHIAVQEEPLKKKSTKRSTAMGSTIKTKGAVSGYTSAVGSLSASLLKNYPLYSDEETLKPPEDF